MFFQMLHFSVADLSCLMLHTRMCSKQMGARCEVCQRFVLAKGCYANGLGPYGNKHRNCSEVFCGKCGTYTTAAGFSAKRIEHTCFVPCLTKAPLWPRGIGTVDLEVTPSNEVNVACFVFQKQACNPSGPVIMKMFTNYPGFEEHQYVRQYPLAIETEEDRKDPNMITFRSDLGMKEEDLSHIKYLQAFPYHKMILSRPGYGDNAHHYETLDIEENIALDFARGDKPDLKSLLDPQVIKQQRDDHYRLMFPTLLGRQLPSVSATEAGNAAKQNEPLHFFNAHLMSDLEMVPLSKNDSRDPGPQNNDLMAEQSSEEIIRPKKKKKRHVLDMLQQVVSNEPDYGLNAIKARGVVSEEEACHQEELHQQASTSKQKDASSKSSKRPKCTFILHEAEEAEEGEESEMEYESEREDNSRHSGHSSSSSSPNGSIHADESSSSSSSSMEEVREEAANVPSSSSGLPFFSHFLTGFQTQKKRLAELEEKIKRLEEQFQSMKMLRQARFNKRKEESLNRLKSTIKDNFIKTKTTFDPGTGDWNTSVVEVDQDDVEMGPLRADDGENNPLRKNAPRPLSPATREEQQVEKDLMTAKNAYHALKVTAQQAPAPLHDVQGYVNYPHREPILSPRKRGSVKKSAAAAELVLQQQQQQQTEEEEEAINQESVESAQCEYLCCNPERNTQQLAYEKTKSQIPHPLAFCKEEYHYVQMNNYQNLGHELGKALKDFLIYLCRPCFYGYSILAHYGEFIIHSSLSLFLSFSSCHLAGSGFDFLHIIECCHQMALEVDVRNKGNKILSFTIKSFQITFLDMFLYTPFSLRDLKKSFDLSTDSKGFFPHPLNDAKYLTMVGKHLPPQEWFEPALMKAKDKEDFLKWYEKDRQTPFCVLQALVSYNQLDTIVLFENAITFANKVLEVSHELHKEKKKGGKLLGGNGVKYHMSADMIKAKIAALQKAKDMKRQREGNPATSNRDVATIHDLKETTFDACNVHPYSPANFTLSSMAYNLVKIYCLKNNFTLPNLVNDIPTAVTQRSSKLEIEYLMYVKETSCPDLCFANGVQTQALFCINGTKYYVDGYSKETKTVYEFLGKTWEIKIIKKVT